MKAFFSRTDGSIFGKWLWTVDYWLLIPLLILSAIGLLFSFSATPAVAERLNLGTYYFIKRHLFFTGISVIVMIGVSFLSEQNIRRLALLMLFVSFVMTLLIPFFGTSIKGGNRWLYICGVSVQPSEFIKPAFAVVIAWLFSLARNKPAFKGKSVIFTLYFVLVAILMNQPDFGMTLTVSVILGTELFIQGLAFIWVLLLAFFGIFGSVTAYYSFPHIRSRIDRFLDPQSGDTFQVRTAMDAYQSGGFFGKGPAEGDIKNILPDAHTDFIMAVVGEEFGILICLLIIGLFAFILMRGFYLILKGKNLFVLLAVSGLLVQFGMQVFVNIASSLSLIPTKGMTLPFISYGGSSLISLSIGMGMILALTRTQR